MNTPTYIIPRILSTLNDISKKVVDNFFFTRRYPTHVLIASDDRALITREPLPLLE